MIKISIVPNHPEIPERIHIELIDFDKEGKRIVRHLWMNRTEAYNLAKNITDYLDRNQ